MAFRADIWFSTLFTDLIGLNFHDSTIAADPVPALICSLDRLALLLSFI
jgi:hypothetical protein